MDAFIPKPINSYDLINTIEAVRTRASQG